MQWQSYTGRSVGSLDLCRTMTSRRAFVLGSAGAFACGRRRATAFPGYAFVANQGQRSIAAVDLTRFSVARQIQLQDAPCAVTADAGRRTVYGLAPRSATVYEIGAADLAVKRKLSLGGTGLSMRLAPGGGRLWVLTRSPHALVAVGLDRFHVESRLKLPAAPEEFDLSRDGSLAAASLPETQSAVLVDLARPVAARVVAAGEDPRGVLFRSDGRQLLVANRSRRILTILDVKTGAILVGLPLPIEPEHLCVKADGGQIFVSGKGMDAVVVVHPYQTEVAETVLAGKAPGALAISAPPEYLFVANPESGDVTVLEVETRKVLAAVTVGQEPCCITFTPDNQYALVVNHHSGDLAVIRLHAITQRRSKTAPLFTMIPVGSQPVSAVVSRF